MKKRFYQIIRASLGGALALAIMSGCDTTSSASDKAKATPRLVQLSGPGFTKLWQAKIVLNKQDTVTNIYVLDDAVHVATAQSYDHALTRNSGDLSYFVPVTQDPHSKVMGRPIVMKDRIVYVTSHSLESFSLHGRPIRSTPLKDTNATSGGATLSDMVFIGDDNGGGRLAAIDVAAAYNPIRWEMTTFGALVSAPVSVEGTIYCASESGAVWAVGDDRSPLWILLDGNKFQTSGKILADLRGDKYGIFIASTDGRLYCINRNTGRLMWSYFAPNRLTAAPEVTATSVYQYVEGTGLVALDKSKKLEIAPGQSVDEDPLRLPRWTAADARQFLSEDDTYTYVQAADNSIIALDKKTGEKAFQSKRHDFKFFGVNTKDSIIYAATESGDVYAIKPNLIPGATGEIVMNFDARTWRHPIQPASLAASLTR